MAWAMPWELAETLEEGVARHGVVGASAAVVTRAGVAWEGHCGLADREAGRAPDGLTVWDWGSITKLVGAVLILQQRDLGRLRLEDPVVRYVPGVADIENPFGRNEAITLEHLLTHTSGLQNGSVADPVAPGGPWPLWPEVERGLVRLKAEAAPGERYAYSNLGFMLLGRVVEAVTRDDWESHATKNFLMPLGMREAYFDQTPYHLRPRRAESYREEGAPFRADVDHGATTSNGGLKACLVDMTRFAGFLLDPEPVLRRSTLEEMLRPRRAIDGDTGIGLGFHVQRIGGRALAGHSGSAAGFRAGVWLAPDAGAALVAVANTATARPLLAELCRAFAEKAGQ
jgi:CubicO group peptidase (beta-lactamase class C family)